MSDVLVIGGGMAGISAAARIAADAQVTVLEAESAMGYHSTGRSAALMVRNYGGPVLRELNFASVSFLEQPEGVSDFSLLSPRGELIVAAPDELDAFESYLAGSRGIERLNEAEALRYVPILRPERIAAAAIEHDAEDIDVDHMLQGFARLLRQRGGQIVTGVRVEAIRFDGRLWHVTAGGKTYQAPVVVNAAGGWADKLAEMAAVTPVGLQPMRRTACLIPAPDGYDITKWPMFVSASERFYAKPDAGKLMISAAEEDPVDPHDVWADDMVLAEGIDRFQQAVTIEVTRVEHTWAGMRSFVSDRTPVVGFAPDAQGFFWLAGQGGYGIQTAPALSQLAADLISGRTPTLPDSVVQALSPDRAALRAV
ncbi:MAG: FAD-binding oxidoreductase [Paracoccus sp. (in: a-proteobacteria)]|uniref:NAD(P)/FAD-dependent oxidoreductase n=1 Tax=Paracoccus sp. TaxID=267 RepID=UPI0026DF9369|nr:FAD-binding oxidoreductase [Paracoccus sp. (in: a-proteobacteria)]MDO5621661.1 FAD-binding oxidoreductase [Paracoccus sp. (in: a-proteobacteria)]